MPERRAGAVAWLREALRAASFALIGLLNTGIDWAVYGVLTRVWEVPPLPAHIIGFTLGSLNSYLLNGSLTFRHKDVSIASTRRMGLFAAVTVICLVVSSLVLVIAQRWMGDLPAKALSTLVTFALGFFLNRTIVFAAYNKA
jgi:putative flippase GtrA